MTDVTITLTRAQAELLLRTVGVAYSGSIRVVDDIERDMPLAVKAIAHHRAEALAFAEVYSDLGFALHPEMKA